MTEASVIVPSRERPEKLERIIGSIRDTTRGIDTEIIAVLDEPDEESHLVAHRLRVTRVVTMPSHYVIGNSMQKWQAGYRVASCEWVVQSSDDIIYDDGWLTAALAHNDPKVTMPGFVGLWDPRHEDRVASLFMATKTYIESVMHGHFTLTWYYANWADNEWTMRARDAGALTFCQEASFTHLHYNYTGEGMDMVAAAAHARHHLDQKIYFARRDAGWPWEWPEVW